MTNTVKICFITSLTLTLLSVYFIHASAALDSPYIYYYSAQKDAFILERADGTDSQILAHYQLPEDHDRVIGPGWSTSGEWLAWTSNAPGGSLFPNMHVYLVNRSSKEQISVLKELGKQVRVSGLLWSPKTDLLLITYYNYSTSDAEAENIVVYDPNNHSFILRIAAGELTDGWFLRKTWLPDGQSIALSDGVNIYIISLDGAEQRVIPSRNIEVEFCGDYGILPHFFENESIAFLERENVLVIKDKELRTQNNITLPKGHVRLVDWTPDGKYALAYIESDQEMFSYELWFINVDTDSAAIISENVQFRPHCDSPFDKSFWNKSNQAFYVNDVGVMNIIDSSPFSIDPVEMPTKGEVNTMVIAGWASTEDLIFTWRDKNLYASQIYMYDPELEDLQVLAPSDESLGINTTFVTDIMRESFAYNSSGLGVIADMANNKQVEITLKNDPEYGSVGVSEIIWHESGDWLYLLGSIGPGQNFVNIVKSNGSQQRQLALCPADSKSCFGWLPTD